MLAGSALPVHLSTMTAAPCPLACAQTARDLVAGLAVTRLDLQCEADPRLDTDFELVARLRGAWGHALRAAAAAGQPEAIRAHALFFPDKIGGAGHAGPPYRIAARIEGGRFHVTLMLIGFAGRWRDAAFEAMIAALTTPPGLLLDRRNGRRAPLRLVSANWTRSEGVEPPEPARAVVLEFHTPLMLGPSGVLGSAFDDILVGLADRAAQMEPWIGLRFEPRLSWWRDRARALSYDCNSLRPVTWDMYSSVNGRTKASGYVGRLAVTGADEEVLALLAAGTVLHAGGSVSKGCGRYDLYPRPW